MPAERPGGRTGAAGSSLESFIRDVLERDGGGAENDGGRVLSGPEAARAFRVWAENFSASMANFSLEDVSRKKCISEIDEWRKARFTGIM